MNKEWYGCRLRGIVSPAADGFRREAAAAAAETISAGVIRLALLLESSARAAADRRVWGGDGGEAFGVEDEGGAEGVAGADGETAFFRLGRLLFFLVTASGDWFMEGICLFSKGSWF